ncbi:SDR family oxidoreductase [Pedobacter alluvionis]|uniref:NAD-dependent epimerase/dehydratase family protein n=1 Tax=Pedobacter alluvionis TaxID=475253 RepID=A0A497XTR9_9SPHI|nr:SDR family oxidoreductase [Pedobacter alluvionis]RLJ72729.1 thioester reductase-like protein [Pedobacter alluvionis]TFB29431.1 NAD-dependent epimerase/dehydratase family protein [Pedobacter alluvionis]
MQIKYSSLVALFIEIAKANPDRIAIKDRNKQLSYKELNLAAAKVSIALTQTINPGDLIVCVSRKDADSIICFWGILFAGGIPVMLDEEDGASINKDKINSIVPQAMIVSKEYSALCGDFPFSLYTFHELLDGAVSISYDDYNRNILFPEICYILLTSGTTGKPKAVQISHQNVLHYTFAVFDVLNQPDRLHAAHVTTFAADLGMTNVLMALVSGGMLRILNKIESTDPAIFNKIINDDQISFLKITPSHITSLIDSGEQCNHKSIETIVLGGEKLSWETVKNIFLSRTCETLYNHYGPTETTVGAMMFHVNASSVHFDRTLSVPIGKPLGDTVCFLANAGHQRGELYIGGPGVSPGYLTNGDENTNSFILEESAGQQTRYYRTGDFCEKLADGNYEFFYRTDRQVKVKGYRIELGEVERVILAHPSIEHAFATTSVNSGHHVLDAYIKLIDGKELKKEELKHWLLDKLTPYKIPGNIFFYTDTPFNSNGKIDLAALVKQFQKTELITTVNENDELDGTWAIHAAACWKKVLNVNFVSNADHFFEQGGDSLLAIQLIGKLQRLGYKIRITDLNYHPVFKEFVGLDPLRLLMEVNEKKLQDADQLTFSQHHFLSKRNFDLDYYCQSILLETKSSINTRNLAIAMNLVIQGHSQLSKTFKKKEDLNIFRNGYLARTEMGVTILARDISVSLQIQEVSAALLKEIKIEQGKLFVAHVFIDTEGNDYLFMACHHLAIDVISWNIIIDELLDYYEQTGNNKQVVVARENAVAEFYTALNHKKYVPGASFQSNYQPLHKLPVLQQYSSNDDERIGQFNLELNDKISYLLRHLDEKQSKSTVSGYLLSAFASALMEKINRHEITVDVEFHGRPQHKDLPDLSRSVAWWALTMPVNIRTAELQPEITSSLIDKIALSANDLNLYKMNFDGIGSGRADILFNYLGYFPEKFGNESIEMKPAHFNSGLTRSIQAQQEYKIYFTCRFIGESIMLDIHYQSKYFSRDFIKTLLQEFIVVLKDSLNPHDYPDGLQAAIRDAGLVSIGQPLHQLKQSASVQTNQQPKTVFLTGATGFLGAHLLNELVQEKSILVYCLVRGGTQQEAEERLKEVFAYYFEDLVLNKEKVRIVRGDLSKEHLGMSTSSLRVIVEEADLILHAAADINLLKDYFGLKETNINALGKLIDIAKTGKKKTFHYISTLAVAGYLSNGSHKDFAEDDFNIGQSFMSDYEKTKYEGEAIIRSFYENGGTGKIYRVGHIAAESSTGKFQWNIEQNRIFQIIQGAMLLEKIPRNYTEEISFSYVDVVAKGIVEFCLGKDSDFDDCVHIENPYAISFPKIIDMLKNIGFNIEFLDLMHFNREVEMYRGNDDEKSIVHLMDNWVQRYIRTPRCINYIHKRSIDSLAKKGIYFPETTLSWFSKMIQQGIVSGYFKSRSDGINENISFKLDLVNKYP